MNNTESLSETIFGYWIKDINDMIISLKSENKPYIKAINKNIYFYSDISLKLLELYHYENKEVIRSGFNYFIRWSNYNLLHFNGKIKTEKANEYVIAFETILKLFNIAKDNLKISDKEEKLLLTIKHTIHGQIDGTFDAYLYGGEFSNCTSFGNTKEIAYSSLLFEVYYRRQIRMINK